MIITQIFLIIYHIVVYVKKENPFWEFGVNSTVGKEKQFTLFIIILFIINLIAVLISGSEGDSGVGQYTYYVNGVNVGSDYGVFSDKLFLIIFLPVIEFFLLTRISYIPIFIIKAFSSMIIRMTNFNKTVTKSIENSHTLTEPAEIIFYNECGYGQLYNNKKLIQEAYLGEKITITTTESVNAIGFVLETKKKKIDLKPLILEMSDGEKAQIKLSKDRFIIKQNTKIMDY
jgi:hypothetical protein